MRALGAVVLIATCVSVQACDMVPGTPEHRARSALSGYLIDPYSAKIRVTASSPTAVCGFVNAKNRMGAFVGQQPFIASTGYPTLEVFDGAPTISDYRSWSADPKSAFGNSAYDKMEIGCRFPADWQKNCPPGQAADFPVDAEFCAMWEKQDFAGLRAAAEY